MASVKTGFCPSCGKDRPLAFFQFGIIKSTMCVYCLDIYLKKIVIPNLERSNRTDDDNIQIGVQDDE